MRVLLIFAALALSACATVRQSDLDAWKNQPVEKLDTHSFWVTIPMKKVVTKDGIEHRFYINSESANKCFENTSFSGNGSVYSPARANSTSRCVSDTVTCNNIFKIKDGVVLSYEPKGRCMTAAMLRPES